MFMDLNSSVHDDDSYKKYILGSAEVVGLMCLKVFVMVMRKNIINLNHMQ